MEIRAKLDRVAAFEYENEDLDNVNDMLNDWSRHLWNFETVSIQVKEVSCKYGRTKVMVFVHYRYEDVVEFDEEYMPPFEGTTQLKP